MAIPHEDEARLLEAAMFMDNNECNAIIPVGRGSSGKTSREILDDINAGIDEFSAAVQEKFGQGGEW